MNTLVDYIWKLLIQNSWSTAENEIRKKCSGLLVSEKLWCSWDLKLGCSIWQVANLSVNSRPLAASMKIYSSSIRLKFWKTAACAWILVAKFLRDSTCTILAPAGKYAEILHVIAALVFCGVGWICVLASDVKKTTVLYSKAAFSFFCGQWICTNWLLFLGWAVITLLFLSEPRNRFHFLLQLSYTTLFNKALSCVVTI